MKRLTEAEIDVLEKLAKRTGMDCWFSIKNETSIYDLENNKTISLKNALEDFNDGIVDIQDYGLTKKEIEIYQNLIDDVFPKKEVGSRLHLEGDENKDSQEKGYMNKEMYKENLETLNTIDSFIEGFKIERDGKIITLTPDEMSGFRYLEKARDGRNSLATWGLDEYGPEDENIIQNMMEDEELCYNITQDYENEVFTDTGSIEQEVVKKYIEKAKLEKKQSVITNLEDIKEKMGDMYSSIMKEAIQKYLPYNEISLHLDYKEIKTLTQSMSEHFAKLNIKDLRKNNPEQYKEMLSQILEEKVSSLNEYIWNIEVDIQNKFNELATEYFNNEIVIDMQLIDLTDEMYGRFGVANKNIENMIYDCLDINIGSEIRKGLAHIQSLGTTSQKNSDNREKTKEQGR